MATSDHRILATQALKIEDIFTCVGHAPSRGRKCQNPIAAANRQYASNILGQIDRTDINSTTIDNSLGELAERLLCKRNHQNQKSAMVSRWLGELEVLRSQHRPRRAESVTHALRTTPRAAARAMPTPTTQRTTPVRARTTAATPTIPPPAQQLPTPPPSPTRRAFPTPAAPRNPISTPSPSRSPSAPPPTITATVTATRPATPPPSSETLSLQECSICYDDIPANTGVAAHCDHHFHVDCINEWLDVQDAAAAERICPYCRSTWDRKRVEGDCEICCDALIGDEEQDDDDDDDDEDDNDDEDGDEEEEDDDDNESDDEAAEVISEETGEGKDDEGDDEEEEDDDEAAEVTEGETGEGEDDEDEDEEDTASDDSAPEPARRAAKDLVWCKSCCGQNFHRECMNTWLEVPATAGRAGRCPNCRADWVP